MLGETQGLAREKEACPAAMAVHAVLGQEEQAEPAHGKPCLPHGGAWALSLGQWEV